MEKKQMVLEGLYYTKEHEWVKIETDTAVVGITDYAQQSLGEITFVELPAAGKKVEAGGELAIVESSKAASDVYCPLAGEIIEINSQLESEPELINEDCFGQGWICKLKIEKPDLTGLMNSQEYEQYIKGL